MQILLKLKYKGHRIITPPDAVTYAGIYLLGRALEWFKPYLIEYQTNRATTTNLEMKYIFLNQENFKSQLTQIFRDLEEEATAEQKLYILIQKGSARDYITIFQIYIIRTNWNKRSLIALYQKGLKIKVQNIIILIKNTNNLKELINQTIKIDNRIY